MFIFDDTKSVSSHAIPIVFGNELRGFRFFDKATKSPICDIKCDVTDKTVRGDYKLSIEDLNYHRKVTVEVDNKNTGTKPVQSKGRPSKITSKLNLIEPDAYCINCGCNKAKLIDIGLCEAQYICNGCGKLLNFKIRKDLLKSMRDPTVKINRIKYPKQKKNDTRRIKEFTSIQDNLIWGIYVESVYWDLNIIPYWRIFNNDMKYTSEENEAIEIIRSQVKYHDKIEIPQELRDRLQSTLKDRLNYRKQFIVKEREERLKVDSYDIGGAETWNRWMSWYPDVLEATYGPNWQKLMGYWNKNDALNKLLPSIRHQLISIGFESLFRYKDKIVGCVVPVLYNNRLTGLRFYDMQGNPVVEFSYSCWLCDQTIFNEVEVADLIDDSWHGYGSRVIQLKK